MDEIGSIQEGMGKTSEAEQSYRDALAYNPHYGIAYLHLARLLKFTGSLSEARGAVQSFLTEWQNADPDIPEVVAAKKLLQELPL